MAWIYYDLLELYSDQGNIKVLEYILKHNNIKYTLQKVTINTKVNLQDLDIIFLGGGSDLNQQILSDDLFSRKEDFKKALNNKVFILAICGGYQMFGKYYLDLEGNKIKCLNIFDFYTEASTKRCVGNIEVEGNKSIFGKHINIIGFENHAGQTKNVKQSQTLGSVVHGYGNTYKSEYEGYVDEYFIGTYIHGPLLSKNPEIGKHIIEKILRDKYDIKKSIKLNFLKEIREAKKEVKF